MPEPTREGAKDLYELLEVSSIASPEVIQAAYHALARTWHPDVNKSPDALRRIRDLNGAYEVLGDGERRAIYDLQRARMRRRQRLIGPTDRRPPALTVARRGSEASDRRLAQQTALTSTRDRRPLKSGQALLVVAVLASVVAVALLLVWFGLALSEEPQPGSPGIVVEMRHAPPMLDVPHN